MQRLRHRLYTVSEALEEVLNESSSDDDEDVSDNSGSEVDAVIDSANSMLTLTMKKSMKMMI